ncbi:MULTISPECIES: DUF502 domain-containing protein [Psychrilyobacter]|uniref:DUF502 domain-containing protein n=1 Tax=Psychrilyobacter piezotolerans TaxID=2293438 RepID=A0ABX9KEJ9_9FUSO|nr:MULTISPECIES: DUF502 domain-containing protein [Psychrilyobacter]MCS5421325.1 DUF502 domain-containing protein [Psychrilyobacter sp. S5]NDI78347.1 DUF502 domain-containing protein [Psychrilyobacter piezotolerans]RDE59694.1 DUF502 domain-containing protein [Psychrilyobacter sp. S5]REI40070.1 DUF502 domain-containing protein [Psychrilyobacter piezotolerans]
MKRIKSLFATGLITVLPVLITINIMSWIFKFLNNYLSQNIFVKEMTSYLLKNGFYSKFITQMLVYLIAVTIIILTIIITGLAMRNVMGKKIAKIIDRLFSNIPLVKPIYTTILQIRHLMFTSNTKAYQKVVMIEYPRKGIYSLGFLTNRENKLFEDILGGKKLLNIFIPTSPNPTSGMFIMVEADSVRELDIKIEDAVKLIISGGAIVPKINKN